MTDGVSHRSTNLTAFGELTATSIYVIWSRLLAMRPVTYPTRTDLISLDAGDLFVYDDCVMNLLQPAFEGALCDEFGHLGYFDRFRHQ